MEEHDQSMEEILQSIKRIIADEEGDAPPKPQAAPKKPAKILELTELVEEGKKAAPAPKPAPKPMPMPVEEKIISDEAVEVSASMLDRLKQQERPARPRDDSMPFRSGYTVEDLVVEALKPMLKEWLDANLPALVEDLVDREIRRISQ